MSDRFYTGLYKTSQRHYSLFAVRVPEYSNKSIELVKRNKNGEHVSRGDGFRRQQ